jgi:uncharacterized protein (TIGR02466 family)
MINQFPKALTREDYFKSPIWFADAPEFVKELNKASDPYIKAAKKNLQKDIKRRQKEFKMPGDFALIYHSSSLIGDPKFKQFQNYIGATSHNLLDEQGYDLTNYQVFITEMWVQEFPRSGGGHHTLHTHWNGHISGFYFLKASDKTSRPMFQDPCYGRIMNMLPEKKTDQLDYASWQVNYQTQPGKIIFFPSYLPHMYIVDPGVEPFRFIHFNCQAIPKGVLNAYKNQK